MDGVYHLSNGESKKINNIKSGGTYIFYVPAKEEQNININLTTNYIYNNPNPFTNLSISQLFLNETIFNDKVSTNISISKTTKTNTELISSFSYNVTSDLYEQKPFYGIYYITNYVALKIMPSNIKYLTVKFEVLANYYNLSNGDITLNNLKAETVYGFYLNMSKFQLANINLEINDINEKPFNCIKIYESADNYSYDEMEIKSISFSKKENNLISSFSYALKQTKNETNFIFIRIKPNSEINYLMIKQDVIGGMIKLTEKASNNITNLKLGGPYYFMIETEKFQKITFNLALNNMNIIPFESVTIKEYDFNSLKKCKSLKESEKNISFSSSNSQIISTFSYVVSKYWNRHTALNIIPTININYLKLEVEKTYYSAYNNNEGKIYNLKAGNKYYLEKTGYLNDISKLYLTLYSFTKRFSICDLCLSKYG